MEVEAVRAGGRPAAAVAAVGGGRRGPAAVAVAVAVADAHTRLVSVRKAVCSLAGTPTPEILPAQQLHSRRKPQKT